MADATNNKIIELCEAALKELNSDKRLKLIKEINQLVEKHSAERRDRAKSAGE